MESTLYTKKSAKPKQVVGLLPFVFKRIGIAVMLLTLVPVLFYKTGLTKPDTLEKEFMVTISLHILTLGMLIIAWARDRVEDERTLRIRLASLGFSFIMGAISAIAGPFIMLLVFGEFEAQSARDVVFLMLIIYLIGYYSQKKYG